MEPASFAIRPVNLMTFLHSFGPFAGPCSRTGRVSWQEFGGDSDLPSSKWPDELHRARKWWVSRVSITLNYGQL